LTELGRDVLLSAQFERIGLSYRPNCHHDPAKNWAGNTTGPVIQGPNVVWDATFVTLCHMAVGYSNRCLGP